MLRFVLFDLDGTLTDPETGITLSVAYALEGFGIHVDDPHTLTPFIGPPLQESFMRFCGLSEPDAAAAVARYRERFSVTGIFENEVYPGIPALLASLSRAGLRLGVASSKPEVYVRQILEHFSLSPAFSVICGSELDGRRVKKDEVIAYALRSLGSPLPESVLMVGDREHDVFGAKANALPSLGVLYGFGSRDELTAAGADYLAETVKEAETLILSLADGQPPSA